MILVTVGTHHQGFDRLVQAMDDYAATTSEPVVIQRGSSAYVPRHARSFTFADYETMESLNREARLVVAHAAAGAVLLAIRLGKPLVVVPRLRGYGEHMDDHQRQLAAALAERRRARMLETLSFSDVCEAIEEAPSAPMDDTGRRRLVAALRQKLQLWDAELSGRPGRHR
jgi:beta-1,4-N-acetylglucosaminyltransferase